MIWIILFVGIFLRVISLNQSLWLDEAINVLATKNFSFLGIITEYAKGDFHPPLYFVISYLWNNIFGTGEVSIRIPSVIFGVSTIYIVYSIGKKLHSKTLGLISAFLLAINPLHIYYSQEARMYALATLTVSINFLLFIKFIKREKLNLSFYIISNLFVLASDYVAYFIFPAQLIFLLISKSKNLLKKWFLALIGGLIIGSFWIPTFLTQLNVGSVASSKLPAWKLIVGSFDIKGVPLTFVKFIIGRISFSDKLIYGLAILPVTLIFLFLLWRGINFIRKKDRNLLTGWLVVPIILATVVSFLVPIYSYFRLLFVLPAFVILIALGIISFRAKLRYLFLAAVFLIELFSAGVYLFNPSYQREDWKGAVNFLKTKEDSLVLFESSGTLPSFDYYSKGEVFAKGALKDFPVKEEGDVIDIKNYGNIRNIYLVDYLVDISDQKRLVSKNLLKNEYKNTDTIDFHGVGFIYHYAK